MKNLDEKEAELKRLIAESGMDYPTQVLLNAKIDLMFECERSLQRWNRIGSIICIALGIIVLIAWVLQSP